MFTFGVSRTMRSSRVDSHRHQRRCSGFTRQDFVLPS